ncbi:DUF4920 domain-containing protein [Tenacibaculum ovolyticum]|uniref:DUF4920 domain-containing protein n=1 Tax=Tenacibaculum ovolyticum TaxID=104270 RepID=UPI0003FCAD8C|nr:DUF4920 domain-containing protein [Tenacibaculum ovolyticum]
MKRILVVCLVLGVFFTACKTEKKEIEKNVVTEFVSFGEKISAEKAITKQEMAKIFDNMNTNDTVNVKFIGKVAEVCQKKGCWIKVSLDDEKKSFVKFKDYAFFMPFNAAGSEVVLNGKAFKNEVSVKELQHYAKDAGKSDEEIAEIKSPKITYSFLADGVLLASKTNEK